MAVELIKSPIGHKLAPVVLEAQIIDDGTGEALVYTQTSHLLSDGQYVYIQSNFDSYNGFKYVDSIAYDSFKIRDSENSDPTLYVQDADIEYQVSVLDHGFQCVHLPIVYELQSDIYPNNIAEESYNPNVVDSFADAEGNTQINLDHVLSDPTEFSKIELVGTGPLAGVYKILEVLQPWSVVINLAYDATNDFSGYIIVKYYDNYAINVNVYAGFSAAHRWQSVKPYELAVTLKFVPDEDGKVKFSIAEVLRAYINNRNNLTLDTLPNNTDFVTGFYISYFETYDESDGEDITTFTGDVTEDDFTGYAVNAKLEFKSESIGHLSDYLDSEPYYAEWLSVFENPIIMVGYFFDLSFLNQYNNSDILITINGVDYLTIEDPGIGVIRVPIEAESGQTQLCIKAFALPNVLTLSDFVNRIGMDVEWTTGPFPSVTVPSPGDTNTVYIDYPFVVGESYTVSVGGNQSGGFSLLEITDEDFNVIFSDNDGAPGAITLSRAFTATTSTTKIVVRHDNNFGGTTLTLSSLAVNPEIEPIQITEEICLTVLEDCDSTFIDGARLLEDGNFRLLE